MSDFLGIGEENMQIDRGASFDTQTISIKQSPS